MLIHLHVPIKNVYIQNEQNVQNIPALNGKMKKSLFPGCFYGFPPV